MANQMDQTPQSWREVFSEADKGLLPGAHLWPTPEYVEKEVKRVDKQNRNSLWQVRGLIALDIILAIANLAFGIINLSHGRWYGVLSLALVGFMVYLPFMSWRAHSGLVASGEMLKTALRNADTAARQLERKLRGRYEL